MNPSEFARALAERGVLVTEGLMDGRATITFELYRDGDLVRVPFIDDGEPMALSVRRAICAALGLDEGLVPVSTKDILEPDPD